eukprot:scaffold1192_cov58-Cylindrotheca_fusiformis.AAC.3
MDCCRETISRPASPALLSGKVHQSPAVLLRPGKKRKLMSTRVSSCLRFSEDLPSTSSSTVEDLTEDEIHRLWYQDDEIRILRKDARNYIRGKEVLESRGFERFDLDRVRNKDLARKCTLKAFQCGFDSNDLANLASECTASARQQALLTGATDYCIAYHDDLNCHCLQIADILSSGIEQSSDINSMLCTE